MDGNTKLMAEQLQEVTGAGEEVFLTGASGFVGSHVLRALLAAQYRVRALVRPGSRPLPPLEGCTAVVGDIERPGDLIQHMAGCRYLIHVAALYSFLPGMHRKMFETNVTGTAGLLEAAHLAGIERAIVTSSSSTVGPSYNGRLATEEDWDVEADSSAYHRSKLEQARAALAAQVPVVLILPTAPVGPGDWKPTPTGKMIVDFMRGRIFGTLGGGMNVVAVEDVARAHVLALRRGRLRERYLVGGENLGLSQLWERLAQICGRTAPTIRIPYHLALSLGLADELRCKLLRDGKGGMAAPLIPLEGVRMARHHMYVSCAKAQAELGYEATAVTAALERAVRWYNDNGYAT
ncbi:MAG TPA: NAD-dependent epimerase/dehydratase family protein [Ktedonobacteraceae bacterium]|jgi:dihydroflavonol-4-reductase|nr:NAD-dependent epimerase/dehydratase family protein [Ktedonobacteraceae bacterium]